MRILAPALVLALLMPPVASADAPEPLDLPKEVQRQRDLWLQCTAAAAKAHIRGARPAADIADLALQRCKAQEQALSHVLNRQLGASGAVRVLELVRETDRSNLVRVIEELRARQ
jgi:hypothetical protein